MNGKVIPFKQEKANLKKSVNSQNPDSEIIKAKLLSDSIDDCIKHFMTEGLSLELIASVVANRAVYLSEFSSEPDILMEFMINQIKEKIKVIS